MGTAMVSDGFFPFRDGVDAALAHGVSAIAQPGGSIRDHEVIEAVNEASPQVAMVFTGQRSFKFNVVQVIGSSSWVISYFRTVEYLQVILNVLC